MALKADVALHIQWPQTAGGAGRGRGGGTPAPSVGVSEAIETIRQALADARAYGAARKANHDFPHDASWESLQDVLAGKLPVVIHADDLRQITAAVAFAQQEKLKLIIAGGYDAPQCAPLLKKYDIPVIVRRADAGSPAR